MSRHKIQGAHQDQARYVVDSRQLRRDRRPPFRRVVDGMARPPVAAATLVMAAMAVLAAPGFAEWLLLAGFLYHHWVVGRKRRLPLRLPASDGGPDWSDFVPGSNKPKAAGGILHLGLDRDSGQELWISNSDARTHALVLGTTGAGKAQPLDSRVHTPSGWRPIGALRPGDAVSVPGGPPASVAAVFPQGVRPVWRLTLEDGRQVRATGDHLWRVSGTPGTLATAALAARLAEGGTIAVPLPGPIDTPLRDAAPPCPAPAAARALADGRRPPDGFEDAALLPEEWRNGLVAKLARLRPAGAEPRLAGRIGWTGFRCPAGPAAQALAEVVRSLGGLAWEDGAAVLGAVPPAAPPNDPGAVHWIGVTAVALDGEAEAACILVDHGEHLYVTDGWTVTHNTEFLLSFVSNAMTWGSGFLYTDGKGDTSLYAKVYSMARRFGRDDDVLILNFMKSGNRRGNSNTLNPFATGSGSELTEMLVSLMDDAGSDGAMWKGRAISLMNAMMGALTELRDGDPSFFLDIETIRDHLTIGRLLDLFEAGQIPEGKENDDVWRMLAGRFRFEKRVSGDATASFKAYLESLAGWKWEEAAKRDSKGMTPSFKSGQVLEQHGYLQMQYTKLLSDMCDTYGYIFRAPLPDIDIEDVVLQRRILVVLLPALEKSEDSIAAIGKIIVASLKSMMGKALGSGIEGGWDDLIENKPTNAPSPFIVVLDEVGYYTVPGMAVMAAQARSLGFCLVFAGQDVSAMKKQGGAIEKEVGAIIANCNLKVFGKLEDPGETLELVKKAAGEHIVSETTGLEGRQSELADTAYTEKMEIAYRERSRVDYLDLKAQTEGQFHVLFGDAVVRMQSYFANIKPVKSLRRNRMIRVRQPPPDSLEALRRRLEQCDALRRRLAEPAFAPADALRAVRLPDDPAARKGDAALRNLHRAWRPLAGLGGTEKALAAIVEIGRLDAPETASETGAGTERDGRDEATPSGRDAPASAAMSEETVPASPAFPGDEGAFDLIDALRGVPGWLRGEEDGAGRSVIEDAVGKAVMADWNAAAASDGPGALVDGIATLEEALGAAPERARQTALRVAGTAGAPYPPPGLSRPPRIDEAGVLQLIAGLTAQLARADSAATESGAGR